MLYQCTASVFDVGCALIQLWAVFYCIVEDLCTLHSMLTLTPFGDSDVYVIVYALLTL